MKVALQKLIREDNFLSLVGNLTISFFGIAGFALLTRTFQVDLFGQWVLYVATGTFIEMFRFGITNTAIIRYLSGGTTENRMKFIGSNGLIGLIATVLISLIGRSLPQTWHLNLTSSPDFPLSAFSFAFVAMQAP